MTKDLPKLSSMILPAFFSLRKSKKISPHGIQINKTFKNVKIEKSSLNKFRTYFDFQSNIPTSFIYTIAQRAQAALMLDKQFTLPIPGMVHIENYITKSNKFNPLDSFDIVASTYVEYKENGALIPNFNIDIHQKDNLVANSKSIYLVKRKSRKQKSKKTAPKFPQQPNHQKSWSLSAKMGREYANISGDKNPIHTSLLFAKILGFEKTIMHGWYSICKIEQFIEQNYSSSISDISVNFLNPVSLPSKPNFELQKDENFNFQLIHSSNGKILLNGVMK